MNIYARKLACLLPLIWLAAAPVWTQDDEKASEEPATVEAIVVKENIPTLPERQGSFAKVQMPLKETPASVSVVEAPILRNQMAVNAGDAMRNVPGASGHTGFGVHDYFVVRGFGSLDNGLVMVDGITDPEAPFYPVFNIDRIEVLKGPTAFLYGANALFGAINVVRKQPLLSDRLQLETTAGSDAFTRTTLDFNHSDGVNYGFRFNGLFQEADNFRDDKDSRQWAINPSFSWLISEDASLKVNLEWVENEHKTDIGLPIYQGSVADVPRTTSYQSPFDRSEQKIARGTVTYEHRLGSETTLRNTLFFTDYDWGSQGTLFFGAFDFPGLGTQLIRSFSMLDNQESRVGNRLEFQTKLETGAVSHQLFVGLELSRLENDYILDVGDLPFISLFNPVETAVTLPTPIPLFRSTGDARATTLAPYFLDRISFSERFQLFLGFRYDYIEFEERSRGFETDYNEVSPFAGFVVTLNEDISLYANYGESFAPPSTLVVTPNLEPETGEQWEIGLKSSFAQGRLFANLAYYDLEKGNIPITSTNFIFSQTGSQSSEGVELELGAALSETWRLFLAYGYTRSKLTSFTELVNLGGSDFPQFIVLDQSGNTSPFAPENTFNLWTTKELDAGWGVGGGLRYLDDHFIAADNAYRIDSHVLLDGFVSYKTGNWKLQLNGRNLTDEDYETRGFGAQSVLPAPGFEALASIQLTY